MSCSRQVCSLILDELHTYRGRQGADVALLVRRVRERLAPGRLLCIRTSATMASEGTLEDKNRVVAGVASKLFGTPIAESNVVTERLERITDPAATVESVKASLGEAVNAGVPPHISDAALSCLRVVLIGQRPRNAARRTSPGCGGRR